MDRATLRPKSESVTTKGVHMLWEDIDYEARAESQRTFWRGVLTLARFEFYLVLGILLAAIGFTAGFIMAWRLAQ